MDYRDRQAGIQRVRQVEKQEGGIERQEGWYTNRQVDKQEGGLERQADWHTNRQVYQQTDRKTISKSCVGFSFIFSPKQRRETDILKNLPRNEIAGADNNETPKQNKQTTENQINN